jgi:glycosyltransferase involved in cell wall biosynthesis
MHILLIHQAFAALDEPGGTRHYELACYLTQRGHRVTIIASPLSYLTGGSTFSTALFPDGTHISAFPVGDGARDEGEVRILRTATYHALHRSFVHRVFAFFSFMLSSFVVGLKVRKVDLVWGTTPPIFQGVTAWLLARLKRVPFLFEVRDLWPAFAIAVGVLNNRTLIRLSEWLERFLYHHAERVIVNSPGFIEHVKSRGAKHVELIPNGAEPGMFDPADTGDSFRALHHLEDRFVALYAGAHGLSNDLGVVLEAAKILQDEMMNTAKVADTPAIHIVLLGDGKEKLLLQQQAAAMGLANVTFVPPMPKNDMATALAAANACIAILKPLDEYKTTYPNKVFDYMAAGRPVVLAIDGVIREVVEAAGCGVFTQPGNPTELANAIQILASAPEHCRAMGLKGRRYVEMHFSRSILAEKLAHSLEEMTT